MSRKNNIKFNYIISNPPYKMGNKITKSVIDNTEFNNFINLMPLSCYKSKELYKSVKSLELADPKLFEDAAITDNLCICTLKPKNQPLEKKSYEDLSLMTYAPQYREFYKLNAKTPKKYRYVGCTSEKSFGVISIDTTFVTSARAANGVTKTKDTLEYRYNVLRDYDKPFTKQNKEGGLAICAYYLNSVLEKNNFTRFYMNNPLMHLLLKGLNKSSGSIELAIPNIDYSIDRDYEHLTLDDIMKILKEETENQTYEDLALKTYKEELREYYKLNISRINDFNKFKLTNKADIINNLIPELDFIVPQKVCNDGVSKTKNCIDYRWNFLHDKNSLINNNGTLSNIWCNPNYHNAKIAKNLRAFWYGNSELMNILLFGLNDKYGHINKAIPNIDWSVDRDYEHLTLTDIIHILKEENTYAYMLEGDSTYQI